MTFQTTEPGSQISVVSLDNPEGPSAAVSNPFTVDSGKLTNRAVKIAAVGKSPLYFFPPDDSGRRVQVRVRQIPSCSQVEANKNRPVRLLLKAYQALTSKDFNLARELSAKASSLDPTLAGSHIITGLAFFQEGRKQDARVAFNKAQALDPEDQEIQQLLRLVQ